MRWMSIFLALLVLPALAGCAASSTTGDNGTTDADFDEFDTEATATTGVIRGLVVDGAIRPLDGASIALAGSDRTAISNEKGLFVFSGLEAGTYFLRAEKLGYNATQVSADVVAGVGTPPIVKILMAADPSKDPYFDAIVFHGFLTFGAAIGITSVGTTIYAILSNAVSDRSIWNVKVNELPMWAQSELVWKQTQPAGGMLIWEMVRGGTNEFRGHRETTVSPALAYWNTTVLVGNESSVLSDGIDYRFFGGPHPATGPGGVIPPENQCPVIPTGPVLGDRNPCRFGYGVTFQQGADAYVHQFYNFAPPEGWRFTKDGTPVIPG